MDGPTDGWMDKWMDGLKDGWIDRQTGQTSCTRLIKLSFSVLKFNCCKLILVAQCQIIKNMLWTQVSFLSSVISCAWVFLCIRSKSVYCRRRSCWFLHGTTTPEGLRFQFSGLNAHNDCLTRKDFILQ